jgi:predicted acyl esterase
MRDGVHLATDIHLPDGGGPFPVILERTPYGRDEASRSELTAADRQPDAFAQTPEEAADILEAWRDGLQWGPGEQRAQRA